MWDYVPDYFLAGTSYFLESVLVARIQQIIWHIILCKTSFVVFNTILFVLIE